MEAISDAEGNFITRMSFDAYGNRRNSNWTPQTTPTSASTFATARGFTGHDMVDAEAVVHMGGRVYDPAIGRFLSADLYVQAPDSSQSYNRYAYVTNNPLSRIDPTGYETCELGEECEEVIVTGQRDAYAWLAGMKDFYFMRDWAAYNSDWRELANLGGEWTGAALETAFSWTVQPMFEGGIEIVFNIQTGNYSAAIGAGINTGAEMSVGKIARGAKAAEKALEGAKAQTEVVQRWMSKAELEATKQTGLLRGGKDGTHYVTDAANTDPLRARQRLALPQTPEVRVTLEVPKGSFSPPSRVESAFNMPGGGVERTATGNIPVQILGVH